MRTKFMLIAPMVLGLAVTATARHGDGTPSKPPVDPARVLVLDGSPVHNAGQLHLHMSNWGMVGSWPNAAFPFSHAPSAEWPAGSGVEYLYTGGLWVGAIKSGVPAVSTSAYQFEFRPTDDPIDVVYETTEGATGGNRLPATSADDDGDGAIDEDPLDGRDNDGDGQIDEDFAAISTQMFSRWYTDDQPAAVQTYPTHNPMNLMVREHSYQWDHPDFDDFVGVDYEITNVGSYMLTDVYVGLFIDGDVGMRDVVNYWTDDAVDLASVATPGGGTVDFAYVYDLDGDAGTATGNFGVVFLDHPTDPSGATAPSEVGISSFSVFSGSQSYEDGGDPTNDFERLALMSSGTIESGAAGPADHRMLAIAGPFASLAPGQSLKFSVALVATPRDGTFSNVVNAATLYQGEFFDVDGDPSTGEDGKEYQAHWWLPGQEPPTEPVEADIRITPRVVNVGSRGAPVKAHVTLPPGYSAYNVDPPILLNGMTEGTIAQITNERRFIVEFDREAFMMSPVSDDGMEVAVTFSVGGVPFIGRDRIDVIDHGGPAPDNYDDLDALRVTHAPNPFNPTARITFELPHAADVTLTVYSTDGKRVRTLAARPYEAGRHEAVWNGRDDHGRAVSSGIYFYRLRAGERSVTKKMVLIK